jgi:hypothetical protein
MAVPKKYLHDHVVLLFLSIDAFLAIIACGWLLLRLSSSHSSNYIVQYRSDLGVNAFKTGSLVDLLSFVGFAILVFVVHTALSVKAYRIHRQLSIAILALAVVLLILTIIVGNALLALR